MDKTRNGNRRTKLEKQSTNKWKRQRKTKNKEVKRQKKEDEVGGETEIDKMAMTEDMEATNNVVVSVCDDNNQ